MSPRVLLVEDDPVTRAYLVAALETLPASVVAVDTVAAARAAATADTYALWLIDANLPDGDGASLLAKLRAAGHRHTPAIAHTATQESSTLQALVDAGFVEALAKPLTAAALHDAVRRALQRAEARVADHTDGGWTRAGGATSGPASMAGSNQANAAAAAASRLPTWDDAVALKALGGERSHVDALRALFTGELAATRDGVVAAARRGDTGALDATLHRLRASCGFVGATRLAAAVAALQAAPTSPQALAEFEAACAQATTQDRAQAG